MIPKFTDIQLLKRFVRTEFWPHIRTTLVAVFFMIITAISTTASVWILQYVIDGVLVKKQLEMVWLVAAGVVLIYVIKGLATFGYSAILGVISAKLSASMRSKAVKRILAQDVSYFDQNETADLVNRVSNVTKSAGDLVKLITTAAMRDFLTVVFLIAFMFYTDWLLALLTFLIAPPVVAGVTLLARRIRNSVRDEFEFTSSFMRELYEKFSGIRLIKSMRAEILVAQKVQGVLANLEARGIRIARISAFNSPLMEALGGFAVAAMILYAGYSVVRGDNTAGEIMAFILAFVSAYEPIKRLATIRVDFVKYLVPLGFYYEIIDRESQQHFGQNMASLGNYSVEFDRVKFSYRAGDVNALSDVSFCALNGQTTALVGRSGSGKSTVLALLQRFYDPSEGAIKIGGEEIAMLSEASLRSLIAYIPQDTTIFTDTIANNIAIGVPDATREQVEAAAEAAYMSDFISLMPNGLDTKIGEGGHSLSGGQKQRLSIARSILKDAPILLLDEATSALDSEAETMVQKAIKAASLNKTVIVIAHRLSTIRNADQILVLNEGQVVEIGNHDELLNRPQGIYAKLHTLQN